MDLTDRQDPLSDNLSARQRKILNYLIKEYIDKAEPVSSELLSRSLKKNNGNRGSSAEPGKKKSNLNVSPATIRNELQELTEQGYITQPHTSAGRVPTNKAYKYFVEIIFTENKTPNLKKGIEDARQKIENELELAQRLTKYLTDISTMLSYTRIQNKDTIFEMLKIIGPSQATYYKNIDVMRELLKEFENF